MPKFLIANISNFRVQWSTLPFWGLLKSYFGAVLYTTLFGENS